MRTELGNFLEDLIDLDDVKNAHLNIDSLEKIKGELYGLNSNSKNIKSLIDDISKLIRTIEADAVNQFLCPECGGELRFELTGIKNYVPYGDIMVCESEEMRIKCLCGYVVEGGG